MKLRDYQTEAVDACWDYLCQQAGSPVIVLPTGAGKSLVLAQLASDTVLKFGGRAMILAHRKELLEQNADKVRKLVPGISVGTFSAGLRRWDSTSPVICAGIQSCFKHADVFGSMQLIMVDEAHLVSPTGEGMYRKFLSEMRTCNPKSRLVGLTATPFRTGDGKICGPEKMFQKVCYEAKIPRLIHDGYLSTIVSQVGDATVDTSQLHVKGGEFVNTEVESLFDHEVVVVEAVAEIARKTKGRDSILVFCSGVSHASHVARQIATVTGEKVGIVTGDTIPLERSSMLSRFKHGNLRWMVNVDVLTTGFDAPNIDAIAILRATCSPGLFAQICGRGFRLYPGKADCLILDFGENISRHGPLDSDKFGAKRSGGPTGIAEVVPVKKCPNCEADVPINLKQCECGFFFPETEKGPRHGANADEGALLQSMEPPKPPETWNVVGASCRLWVNKKSGSKTLRVDYECQPIEGAGNLMTTVVSEWVCIEHEGFAGKRAAEWWRERCRVGVTTIDEAVILWGRGAVAIPRTIVTRREGPFYKIVSKILDEIPEVSDFSNDPHADSAFANNSDDFWITDEDEIPF